MTFSIIGRDEATGEVGVAVQSHFFGAGKVVPWARAGIGAVASQALVNPEYGPAGIAMMEAGTSAAEALEQLIGADRLAPQRQVALIDAEGGSAVYTGADCYPECGDAQGRGVVAQGNMLRNPGIPEAMAEEFLATAGPLETRLLAALAAAEGRGGDARGRQSAGLVVVSGDPDASPACAVRVDLRVEDHPDPVAELNRLVGYDATYSNFAAMVWKEGVVSGDERPSPEDVEGALDALDAAIAALPRLAEPLMWRSIVLARGGRAAEASAAASAALSLNPELGYFFASLERDGVVPSGSLVPDRGS